MSKASDLFEFTPSMEEAIEAIDELLPDGSANTLRRALAAHDESVRAEERERIAGNLTRTAGGYYGMSGPTGDQKIWYDALNRAARIAREGA